MIARGLELCFVVYKLIVHKNFEAVCEYRIQGNRECQICIFPIDIHLIYICTPNSKLGNQYISYRTYLFIVINQGHLDDLITIGSSLRAFEPFCIVAIAYQAILRGSYPWIILYQ